jgi:hypothetical protein
VLEGFVEVGVGDILGRGRSGWCYLSWLLGSTCDIHHLHPIFLESDGRIQHALVYDINAPSGNVVQDISLYAKIPICCALVRTVLLWTVVGGNRATSYCPGIETDLPCRAFSMRRLTTKRGRSTHVHKVGHVGLVRLVRELEFRMDRILRQR